MSTYRILAGLLGLMAAAMPVQSAAENWLEETFDAYKVGPLNGQGDWTGFTQHIIVVSTTSLQGNAVYCDADEPPTASPVPHLVSRPVAVPQSGVQTFRFAVRVDHPSTSYSPQATLALSNGLTHAIQFDVLATSAVLTLNNDYLDCVGHAAWDLGNHPGGAPDLTTGTFHVFEFDIDFGRAGDVFDDRVQEARLDGKRFEVGCTLIPLLEPLNTLYLINGEWADGPTPDGVYFDGVAGEPIPSEVRAWQLY
jgi:hypothetical protein